MIHQITIGLVLLLILAAALAFISTRRGKATIAWLANNALIVNTTPKGRATYVADAALTSRYLLVKPGASAYSIAVCGAADIPFGVCPDMNPTTDTDTSYPLPVNLLGLNEDTERMIASAAIAIGDLVVPAANGQIKTLPATTGTYYIVGRAKTAAAAQNDQVEVVPCFPVQRVVA